MIALTSPRECVETIYALSAPFIGSEKATPAAVKAGYQRFVADVQPHLPLAQTAEPRYVGPDDTDTYGPLYDAFSAKSELDDSAYDFRDARLSGDTTRAAREKLDEARDRAEALGAEYPEFGPLFDLTINFVFTAPSANASGGTTSSALGVLWVDSRPAWAQGDHAEFLVHELTHMQLFLDDWRFGLFRSIEEMVDPSNFAVSAIRGVPRPLDKAFHSAVVSTEVLLVRDRVLGHPASPELHPPSPELASGAGASLASIRELASSGILTERAVELLGRCEGALRSVTDSISRYGIAA